MHEPDTRRSMGATMAVVAGVAILVGVVSTVVQHLATGNSNPALSGGLAGALAAIAGMAMRRRSRT